MRTGEQGEVVAVRTEDGKLVLTVLWDNAGDLEDFSILDVLHVLGRNEVR